MLRSLRSLAHQPASLRSASACPLMLTEAPARRGLLGAVRQNIEEAATFTILSASLSNRPLPRDGRVGCRGALHLRSRP